MTEDEAVEIATEAISMHFPVGYEFLGASYRTKNGFCRDLPEVLLASGLSAEEIEFFMSDVEHHQMEPHWSIGFLIHSDAFRNNISLASVRVDEATRAAEVRLDLTGRRLR